MKKYFILLILVSVFIPKLTSAYTATLNVDSNISSINAVEGTVIIPKNITITQIYDGHSSILFWVDKPTLDKEKNTIRFSGFTPGGFQGKQPLFSISGNFTEKDSSEFDFSLVRALANDGLGTMVPIRLFFVPTTIEEDATPPESFVPVLSRSKDTFDNSYFISFATQDKGVGIDHYEYAVSRFFSPNKNSWKQVESPLVLTKGELSKRIFIKAIDKSGNDRVSTLYAPLYFEYTFIGFIIGVLILCVLFYILKMFL